jgi:hypothetical protein
MYKVELPPPFLEDKNLLLHIPSSWTGQIATMKESPFKNYRVYILTSVAYMGSLLFGMLLYWQFDIQNSGANLRWQVMIQALWAAYLP